MSTEAIAAAFAVSEPNGEGTCLVRLLENAVGMPLADAGAFLKCAPPEKIASYAKIVRHGLRLGDGAAKEIMKNTLDALLAYLRTISAFFTKRVPLYMFDVPQEDRENVKAAIGSRFSEHFDVLFSDVPPVFGAVRHAAHLLRVNTDGKFERYFTETYQKRNDAARV